MQLALAETIAKRLLARFDKTGAGCVAGSVRRRKPEPRDIEILLPWSPADDDPGFAVIAAMCPAEVRERGGLFACGDATAVADPPMFEVVKGLRPGFRYAQLRCPAATDPRWASAKAPDFKIDICRFDPLGSGAGGNLGWCWLQRTGPAEFSEACLAHFKRRGGGGSRDGYLIDAGGRPIPTVTEVDAFQAMSIAWVEPHSRKGYESIRLQTDWHEPLSDEDIPF